jgi:Cu2+-exporting ATPase
MPPHRTTLLCDHCLLPVSEQEAVYEAFPPGQKVFCCHACRAIYLLINGEGLQDFYTKREWKSFGIPEALREPGEQRSSLFDKELESLIPYIRGEGTIKEADLVIDGIRCSSCIWLNEKILERTSGVISARINFATHRALITWDSSRATLGRILSRITSIGYLARPYTPASQEAFMHRENRDLLIRLGTALFFSMQLMLVSFGLYAGYFHGIEPADKRVLELAAFLVCTPVLFYSGWPFLHGAIRGIRNRTLNMDLLISLGSLSAYFLSIHQLFSGGEVYFDTAAMIITLVLLGRYLENSAKHRASQAVSRLLSLQPQDARTIRGNDRLPVPIIEVRTGDRLEVRPGEKIPLDSIVLSGTSEVDESLVTGESRPIEKSRGMEVIGGTLNGLGTLQLEVTRVGRDSTLSQITRLVEDAQAATAPIQRLADRVSVYFIPFVIVMGLATFLFWSQRSSGELPILRAVTVLVIACPCALGLATPVAVLAGTGKAARSGILIKGGSILERLQKVDTVVLDKTGTITTGKMKVVEIKGPGVRVQGPGGEEKILQYAASAEQGSEHLTGQAIVNYAKEQGIELSDYESFKAFPGQGVRATIHGAFIRVGKRVFLEQECVKSEPEITTEAGRLEREGKTVVWVSRGTQILGIIALMDTPKNDAQNAVEQLKRMKIDITMITGDNQTTANAIAEKTGIHNISAGILPAGKSEEIMRLQTAGKVVAMVGDGINDAPALAAADVGMAMAAGSDIAMESADVVLMRSDLSSVVQALVVSRKTFRIIKQNLFWAFFYNVAAIPLAMAGVLSPIVAAAAMAISSVTVVTNSLRLRR